MLLTIAIPTYNRVKRVTELLHDLSPGNVLEYAEILVIDDASRDRTHEILTADTSIADGIQLMRNEVNLGYPRTFSRIFAECKTDYVMIVADDDKVVVETPKPFVEYLEREQPAFVSPQFMRGSSIYRGQGASGPIAPHQFLDAAGHASGLVYRLEKCKMPLEVLTRRVSNECADALVYPQVVVLAMLLIAAEKCEWLAMPTVDEGAMEPSGILDAEGRAYWTVESRWQQLQAIDSLLTQAAERDRSGIALGMRDAHRSHVYSILASAIRGENPDLGAAFDDGAKSIYSRTPISAMKSLIRKRLRLLLGSDVE